MAPVTELTVAPVLTEQCPEEHVWLPFGGRFAYLSHQNQLLQLIMGNFGSELAEPSQAAGETGFGETLVFGIYENRVPELVQTAMTDTAPLALEEDTGLGRQLPSTVFFSIGDGAPVTWQPSSSELSLDHLATQLRIDASLLRAVRNVLREYIAGHPGLTLEIEALMDPEVAGPVEAVFEIRGTRSPQETDRVWEEAEEVLQGAPWSDGERQSILEKVAVHVHRAPS